MTATICSCFFEVPRQKSLDEKIGGDWSIVKLQKRQANHVWGYRTYEHMMERSTGDLYGMYSENDPPSKIATKAFRMVLGTPFQTAAVILGRIIKTVYDIASIIWKVLSKTYSYLKTKGIIATFCHHFMALTFEIPSKIVEGIIGVARAPIYGVGLLIASVFTVIQPLEGRTWVSRIESNWLRATYDMDIRYDLTWNKFWKIGVSGIALELLRGKVFFLGYCMQKRGNIHDKIDGYARYKFK